MVKETPVGDRHVLAALDKDGLRPRGRAVGTHHLPAPGHHRRRPADRAGPGRPGGPAGRPLAELLDGLVNRVPQVLVNVPVPNTELLEGAEAVWSAVAEEEERLGDGGRVLLRPSGTEPLVTGDGGGRSATGWPRRSPHASAPGRVRAPGRGGHPRVIRRPPEPGPSRADVFEASRPWATSLAGMCGIIGITYGAGSAGAGSGDTARCSTSSSRGSPASSTGATTRPGWPWSAPAGEQGTLAGPGGQRDPFPRRSGQAGRGGTPAGRAPASATPGGPPTAGRPRATPIPTSTARGGWPSSTTGSSRTTSS